MKNKLFVVSLVGIGAMFSYSYYKDRKAKHKCNGCELCPPTIELTPFTPLASTSAIIGPYPVIESIIPNFKVKVVEGGKMKKKKGGVKATAFKEARRNQVKDVTYNVSGVKYDQSWDFMKDQDYFHDNTFADMNTNDIKSLAYEEDSSVFNESKHDDVPFTLVKAKKKKNKLESSNSGHSCRMKGCTNFSDRTKNARSNLCNPCYIKQRDAPKCSQCKSLFLDGFPSCKCVKSTLVRIPEQIRIGHAVITIPSVCCVIGYSSLNKTGVRTNITAYPVGDIVVVPRHGVSGCPLIELLIDGKYYPIEKAFRSKSMPDQLWFKNPTVHKLPNNKKVYRPANVSEPAILYWYSDKLHMSQGIVTDKSYVGTDKKIEVCSFSGSTLEGSCGGPYISCVDGAVIGFHGIGGHGNTKPQFYPINNSWISAIQDKCQGKLLESSDYLAPHAVHDDVEYNEAWVGVINDKFSSTCISSLKVQGGK
jgi:hypothetical protein